MSSVPTYAGPSCSICCDLRPNRQFPMPDGTWEDYSAQPGKDSFTLGVFLPGVRQAAEHCAYCALLLEALEKIEGKPIGSIAVDDELLSIYGKLGQPLAIGYDLDGVTKEIEVFSALDSSSWSAKEKQAGITIDRKKDNCIGPACLVRERISPSIAARTARDYLDVCETHHNECRRTEKPVLPKRVIHVGTDKGSLRLYESRRGEREDYVALSYCWGLSQPLTTTKENLQSMLNGLPWDQVPDTLREAMEFTRELGIPYIWIDALCIVQNDAQDWEIEATKMKTIYEHALLTLSATSSPDVSVGCFLPRSKPASALGMPGIYVRSSYLETHSTLFKYSQDGKGIDFSSYVAMSRGWIFQERLLSPRILYAAHDELVWECRRRISCECSPVDRHGNLGVNAVTAYKRRIGMSRENWTEHPDDEDAAKAEVIRMWLELLSAYAHREFGHYTDRLVALSGIAQKFGNLNMLGRYYAGNWEYSLQSQLAWARWPGPRVRECARVGGPSWSWASLNQPCLFNEILDPPQICSRFEVLDCRVDHKTPDPTGAVESGRLKVSVPTVEGTLALEPNRMNLPISFYDTYSGLNNMDMLEVFVQVGGLSLLVIADVCQWTDDSPTRPQMKAEDVLSPGEKVICVELFESIKEPNGTSGKSKYPYRCPWLVLRWSSGGQTFRRVGLIDFSDRHDFKRESQDRELLRPLERIETLVIV